jgi:hypothetical protein
MTLKSKKPPIGIVPEYIFEEQKNKERINDLTEAIKRFTDENRSVPKVWMTELKTRLIDQRIYNDFSGGRKMTDYFEEKIINHVLSFRTRPDGVWNQYTAEQLTSKLVEASIAVQEALEPCDPKFLQEALEPCDPKFLQEGVNKIFHDAFNQMIRHGTGMIKHYQGDVDVQYFGVDYSKTLKGDKNENN